LDARNPSAFPDNEQEITPNQLSLQHGTSWRSVRAMTPAISVRFATNADTMWLSAKFHPRSRNDQGDYRRQADMMSAQRLVCLRHGAAILVR
jgi:hypothetical protein